MTGRPPTTPPRPARRGRNVRRRPRKTPGSQCPSRQGRTTGRPGRAESFRVRPCRGRADALPSRRTRRRCRRTPAHRPTVWSGVTWQGACRWSRLALRRRTWRSATHSTRSGSYIRPRVRICATVSKDGSSVKGCQLLSKSSQSQAPNRSSKAFHVNCQGSTETSGRIGSWSLGVRWSLELGAWDLILDKSP